MFITHYHSEHGFALGMASSLDSQVYVGARSDQLLTAIAR